MVSISKPEAIALILNYIKNPVKPTLKTFAEGKLISVKAIGMPGIASLSSLSSLSSLTTVALWIVFTQISPVYTTLYI